MRPPLTVVPHTHWDREWYLPFEAFRERLVPVLDEVLDLLDRGYPHFHLDGQTAVVDDYLDVRPQREPQVRQHAESGRLSLGPWMTLVDEFLVSGETIVRDLELGLARARELGARGPFVGYLPDQFGHVGQMPQLLRAAGIDTAIVWRGVPREVDRSVFRWEAPDGSRVLADYLPFGYSLGMGLCDAVESRTLANALEEIAGKLDSFAARPRLLVLAGSDHAPPDATLPERLAEACRLNAGLDAQIGSLADYVAEPPQVEVPVWRGELRSAARAHLLPGVVSARISQKQERAEVEALLERYAEPLAALVPGFRWPERELEQAWLQLVLSGAHDSVCGCSLDEVADAVDARVANARAIGDEVAYEALAELAGQVGGDGVLHFNPSTFERARVPGLGWRVSSSAAEVPPHPVPLTAHDGRIHMSGVELTLEDEPDAGDLYNFAPGGQVETLRRFAREGDQLVARAEGLEVRLHATKVAEEPFARLSIRIQNERPDHRLRLRLRLPRPGVGSLAGSVFELVARPLVSEGSELEAPSPTWPARGVVLAGGVAVLAKGVFEYEVRQHDLAVTLLRCVGTISRPHLSTRPAPAGPDIPTPDAQMLGETTLALGIFPNATPSDLLPVWERFALPLHSARVSGRGRLPETGTLLDVEHAQLASLRRREGMLEARLWNPSHAPILARVDRRELELRPRGIHTVVAAG